MRVFTALLLVLFTLPASAAGTWHTGLDLITGFSDYKVSNCSGDCIVVNTDPDDDWHLGVGFTAQRGFGPIAAGATLRLYDANGGDSFDRFFDLGARISIPLNAVTPYFIAGVSRQEYSAQLKTADGPRLDISRTSPLIAIGVEKRSAWGYWFAEISRVEDDFEGSSHRNIGGTKVPVSAKFDVERTSFLLGASINIAK